MTQPGIGSPYDPNSVYSIEGPAPSPTARGNSRYFQWEDTEGRIHYRRLNPREMARCMGVPLELIKGLNDVDAYRLVGNSVSEAMSAILGPIARSLIDTKILNQRLHDYKQSTPIAGKSKTDNSQEVSQNGIVTDCLHQQMWNRITQYSEKINRMTEDTHARAMMPTHPDNKLNEEGQIESIAGSVYNNPDQGLNEEGQEVSTVNTLSGCRVDLNEEGKMTILQEPNTDEDLSISDCLDGGINIVSDEARINAITATMSRQMFDVIEGQCNRVRLDVGRQKNVDEVWDTIKSGQKMDIEIRTVRHYLTMGKSIPLSMKSLQAEARKCHVHNQVVYRMQEDNQDGPMLRLWVPENMQEELTRTTHECPLTCHPREYSLN